MTLMQQRFAWITVGLWLAILVLLAGMAMAEEKPKAEGPKTSYDLPRDQVQEYRALSAEIRAYQSEGSLAIQERAAKINNILSLWKEKYKIDDMSKWSIDIEKSKLFVNKKDNSLGH